jgi:hypothetical protein
MKKTLFWAGVLVFFMVSTSMAQFGGKVGFRRTILRSGSEDLDLAAPVPGLTFNVPMNAVEDDSGKVIEEGTWGFIFNTGTINDKDVRITSVDANAWNRWRAVDVIYGLQLSFIDASGPITESSKTVGFAGALRFNVESLPAEFGGAVARGYDGMPDLWLTDIHLGLVGHF